MQIGPLSLPEELLKAQKDGSLVIFAGAGISKPPPSGLPLFDELARQIASNAAMEMRKGETSERFLGRLKDDKIDIHAAVARILLAPSAKPTRLHHSLLKLFGRHPVRIVTTNFDTHFDSVICEARADLPIFVAPALPLGNDFHGLVYLHGSAKRAAEKCVLTDSDFGRAYLTEGWARRFLVALFSNFTVAFVGYSHSDTTVTYLARAMPPEQISSRFAFTPDWENWDWKTLGIHPIHYTNSSGENSHQALTDGMRAWADHIASPIDAKGRRVRELAEKLPPEPGAEADFLKESLHETSLLRTFVEHAKDPVWLAWLDGHHLLDPHFDPQAVLSKNDHHFEVWLAREFHRQYSDHLFAVIQRHGGRLHPSLCWRLIVFLCPNDRAVAPAETLGRWAAILTAQDHHTLQTEWWTRLLEACGALPEQDTFLLVWSFLTKPRLALKESNLAWAAAFGSPDKVDFTLPMLQDHRPEIAAVWLTWSAKHLSTEIWRILPILETHLSETHRLLAACRGSTASSETLSVWRESIESSRRTYGPSTLDCLVDAARSVLECLIKIDSPQAVALIARWYGSGIPLLRRLAITGTAKREDLSADEKVRWYLKEDLFEAHEAETTWALTQIYPSASAPVRRELLTRLNSEPLSPTSECTPRPSEVGRFFRLLQGLAATASKCPLLSNALKAFRERHPDFANSTSIHSSFRNSDLTDDGKPIDLELTELVANPPDAFLKELAHASTDPFYPKNRDRYVATVSKAVAILPGWGAKVVRCLEAGDLPECCLGAAVCFGWRQADLTEGQWAEVLDCAAQAMHSQDFLESFVDVLDPGRSNSKSPIPSALAEKAEQVAKHIWKVALSKAPDEPLTSEDWLHQAINRAAGRLTEFWIDRLETLHCSAENSWAGIPSRIRETILEMMGSPSSSGAYARIIVASHLAAVFQWDPSFVNDHLIPLFQWESDKLRAEQCWHGFLWHKHWHPSLVEPLHSSFDQLIDRSARLPQRLQEHLGGHIAELALFQLPNPLQNNWLVGVAGRIPDATLITFAEVVGRALNDLDTSRREALWEKWLRLFWQYRVDCIPRPLAPGESSHLLTWALFAGRYVPEAVDLALRMDTDCFSRYWDLLGDILEGNLIQEHPDAIGRLIVRYLEADRNHEILRDSMEAIWAAFVPQPLGDDLRRDLREGLFKAGLTLDP
jgi:hypothetical protein